METAKITVQVLGCGDAFSSGGRFNTCFYIKTKASGFLLDCGGTTLLAMKKAGISTEAIDAIVVSHFHGDHFGGLPYFLLESFYLAKRKKPLTIVTPRGGKEKVEDLVSLLYPGSTEIMNTDFVTFIEYKEGRVTDILDLKLKAFQAIHAPGSSPHSLLLSTANKSIAFTGDTSWSPGLRELSAGTDLFICEATCFKKEGNGHLSYQNLLTEKNTFKTKRLLLTHLGEECLLNLNEINKEFECASDGMVLDL